MLPVIRAVRGPSVSFVRGFVDDLALVGAGPDPQLVAANLVSAVQRGTAALEGGGLKVNMGKGQLVASTEMGRAILRRAQVGEAVAPAHDLGSEVSITARRTTVQ